MRDEIKYVNYLGQTVNLNGDNVYCNYKEALTYAYETKNSRNVVTEKTFQLLMLTLGGKDTINRLIDLFSVDTINNKYGRLYINGWYIRCRKIGVGVPQYDGEISKMSFTFYAPSFEFTKEKFINLSVESGNNTEIYLDFDFGFDFDLGGEMLAKSKVINEQLVPADFVLKFKAITDTVNIDIGGNSYIVASPINAGETFVINTEEKNVYKESENGKIDLFDKSSDVFDIFAKIPSGEHIVSWLGDFSISLLMLEHRSMPLWI